MQLHMKDDEEPQAKKEEKGESTDTKPPMDSTTSEMEKNMLNNMMTHRDKINRATTIAFGADGKKQLTAKDGMNEITEDMIMKSGRQFTIDELEDQSSSLKILRSGENGGLTGGKNLFEDKRASEYYLSVNSKAGLNNIDHKKVHQII